MQMKGKNVRRHRFNVSLNLEGHQLDFSTRFSETTRAGKGAAYLGSGEIDRRSGVEVAIASFFAPLHEAQEGATEDELEESIDASYAQLGHYMNMARNRCRRRSGKRGVIAKLQPSEAHPTEGVPEQAKVEPVSQLPETDPEELDLDNEVF
jgi:hypothetical protein